MMRRLLIICLFILTIFASVPGATLAQSGDLLARVNNLRASVGLPPYTLNGALSAAAQSQAQWMAESGVISHNRPDGSSPRGRALNAGYPTVDVSENIYGGTGASADTAWAFWVNSPIHYNGLVNHRYSEVGIGIASGSVTTYVLVFGNPGGPAPGAPQVASSGAANSAAYVPPSYIKGQDDYGNIMHEVQPGDTLGDIALIYGYTWDDLAYMRQLNSLEGNLLEVGSIFLVPPKDGTYTPAPGSESAESAATPTAENQPTEAPTATPTASPSATPSPTVPGIATAGAMPEVIAMPVSVEVTPTEPEATAVAALSTESAPVMAAGVGGTITRSGPSPWLAIGLVVQVGVLLVAGAEYMRRYRRGRKR